MKGFSKFAVCTAVSMTMAAAAWAQAAPTLDPAAPFARRRFDGSESALQYRSAGARLCRYSEERCRLRCELLAGPKGAQHGCACDS
jgi:hypothetical protein